MTAPSAATRPMAAEQASRIARAFLPERWYGSRYHYFYARTKLRSDPLYPGVCAALRGSSAPVLDLGCGLGLLAHALHADGIEVRYFGADNDAAKITSARRAAARAGLPNAGFETLDLSRALPPHRGSVVILDVLQFLDAQRQIQVVSSMIDMLEPGARLVIRTGLYDGSQRARITRNADFFARFVGWMNAAPIVYPDQARLQALFESRGLTSTFSPLYGDTPFNNWLIVAQPR